MNELHELLEIIYRYDDFCTCWMRGESPDDYAAEMDELRNTAVEIIKNVARGA